MSASSTDISFAVTFEKLASVMDLQGAEDAELTPPPSVCSWVQERPSTLDNSTLPPTLFETMSISLSLKIFFFKFMSICVYVSKGRHVGIPGGQKRILHHLESGLPVLVCFHMWKWVSKHRSSAIARSALECCAISPGKCLLHIVIFGRLAGPQALGDSPASISLLS